MTINLNRLHYFHTVAVEGSQAGAARKLGVAQSTISEQVKQLEATLGVELFERSGGSMELSDAGRRCLQHTETVFSAVTRLEQMFVDDGTTPRLLEVGVASDVARTFASKVFLPLLDAPDVVPRIRHDHHNRLLEQLVAGELDVLLSATKPSGTAASTISAKIAGTLDFIVVADPMNARRIRRYPEDLARQPFVHFTEGSTYRLGVDEFLRTRGIVPRVVMESDDVDLVLLAARRGHGFAAVPRRLAAEAIAGGHVVPMGALDLEAPLFVSFVDAEPTEVVRRAVDLLITAVGTE